MDVSIIIPIYNSRDTLKTLIDSILALEPQPHEIILIDDNSTDAPETVLSLYKDIKYIKIPSNQGPSYARNLGSKNASGQLLLFIDADCVILTSDCIKRHKETHQSHENIILGGAVQGMRNGIIGRGISLFNWADNIPNESGIMSASRIPSAHFSILKKNYDIIGGFDETLRAGEDTFFYYNAINNGMTPLKRGDIVVGHFDITNLLLSWKKFIGYGMQRIIMKRKGIWGNKGFLISENILVSFLLAPFIALGLTFERVLSWIPHYKRVLFYLPLLYFFSLAFSLGLTVFLFKELFVKKNH
jgi:glycosyltransferase involved in cell wall biosynthesis